MLKFKYFLHLIGLTLPFFCVIAWGATPISSSTKDILKQLDKTLAEETLYTQEKEKEIDQLKARLPQATEAERYSIFNGLFDAYKKYQTDSALHYVDLKEELLLLHPALAPIEEVQMNRVEELSLMGMYKEALDILEGIDTRHLTTPELRVGYYHQYRSLYGYMADYCPTPKEKQTYFERTNAYRDTLISIHKTMDQNSLLLTQSEQLIIKGEYQKAIDAILPAFEAHKTNDIRLSGLLAYNLSEAYRGLDDEERQIYFLAYSAMSDIQLAIKEYIALPRLAQILFSRGDIDRAHAYLNQSMRDAVFCGARLRTMEVTEIYPIVSETYKIKERGNQKVQNLLLLCFTVLILFLIGTTIYIYRQMKKIAEARHALARANEQLVHVNEELSQSNLIKQQYIAHYLDQCTMYLDKLEDYRRSLANLAISSKINELFKAIKSERFIEEERAKFYRSFDETFLNLFPNFVESCNAHLIEEERIHPKPGELLSPELRIFALIRLGITDSNKIARFLRYSLNTIYIYRSKVRNKALGDKNLFDQEVMRIK